MQPAFLVAKSFGIAGSFFPAFYAGATAHIPSGHIFGIGESFHDHICCETQS